MQLVLNLNTQGLTGRQGYYNKYIYYREDHSNKLQELAFYWTMQFSPTLQEGGGSAFFPIETIKTIEFNQYGLWETVHKPV